jgi:hypothetical protein
MQVWLSFPVRPQLHLHSACVSAFLPACLLAGGGCDGCSS